MSFSQYLRQLGQPIAYYPQLAKPLGGVTAAILFGQLFFWQDKTGNPLGVYKTQAELEQETGLSRREQETARKKLVELGILIETHKRLEHRIYFRLDLAKFDALMESDIREVAKPTSPNGGNMHHRMAESDIREVAKPTFVNTENTTENTTENNNSSLQPKTAATSPKRKYIFSEVDMRLAKDIFAKIKKLNPNHKEPIFEAWANDVRLLSEIDGKNHAEIFELFSWANQDSFWQTNILSPRKLREKWDVLTLQRGRKKPQRGDNMRAAWNTPEAWAEVL